MKKPAKNHKNITLGTYDPAKIESKWQKQWAKTKIYSSKEESKKQKYYALDMFPYPSGEGLHVGHPKGYIATDIVSRFQRMNGKAVLHPMGFDAFGLPAENYAIKTKTNPVDAVNKNVKRFKKQLELIGLDYDWSREVNTTDPKYYKWTQWIFLQMWKKGLAYESFEPINWCPSCKTGLANEDVENGRCERCGTPVEKKPMRQWVLRITKYADRLLTDLDAKDGDRNLLDWPESIKEAQRNWIGRSEGALIKFALCVISVPYHGTGQAPAGIQDEATNGDFVEVFTTRPDTIFGVTYLVLAPEHKLVSDFLNVVQNKKEVEDYISRAKNETEIERTDAKKDKTGVELKGVKVINPANGEEVPVWIADYVLADYGTGAVMAVPAHDERDWEFAKKFGLPIKEVISGGNVQEGAYIGNGALVNSADFSGKNSDAIKKEITTFVGGNWVTKYKLRDWVFSRQRYWGEPIPLIHCEKCAYDKYKSESKLSLNFYYAPIWQALKNGTKTLETRALNTGENERYFGDLQVGDIVHATYKDIKTKAIKNEILFRIKEKKIYQSLDELFNDKVALSKLANPSKTLQQFESSYSFTPDYLDRIKNNGLIAWEIEPVTISVPVPEKDLPVILPKVKSYEPTGTGESPLAGIAKWVNVKCPVCKGKAKRETNTMPQWAGSSWYYLRYEDPKNNKVLVDLKKEKYWSPVDLYVGGAEHATRHLIYARFWHKFLYDIGAVSTIEPFIKLQNVGLIMGEDGRKMSKRFGNVVNPDDIVKNYGADTLRLYEMFMGPFDQQIAWSTSSIVGARRFVERIWKMHGKLVSVNRISANIGTTVETATSVDFRATKWSETKTLRRGEEGVPDIDRVLHQTIKKVTEDIQLLRFNTAISALMILSNEMEKAETIGREQFEILLKLLAPFAPHMTEELWMSLGNKKSIHVSDWPNYDPKLIVSDEVRMVVQINGKVRGSFTAAMSMSDDEIKKVALALPDVEKWITGKEIKKIIVIKGKLVSVVI